MGKLVIKRLKAIVSCDANDTVYENADMLIEDNKIAYIGDMSLGTNTCSARRGRTSSIAPVWYTIALKRRAATEEG